MTYKLQSRLTASIALLLLAITILLSKGLSLSSDILGGVLIEASYEKSVSIHKVRKAMTGAGYSNAEIRYFGTSREISIITPLDDILTGDEHIEHISTLLQTPELPVPTFNRIQLFEPAYTATDYIVVISLLIFVLLFFPYMRLRERSSIIPACIAAYEVLLILATFVLFGITLDVETLVALLAATFLSSTDTLAVINNVKRYRGRDTRLTTTSCERVLSQQLKRNLKSTLTFICFVSIYWYFGFLSDVFAVTIMVATVIRFFTSIVFVGGIIRQYSLSTNKPEQVNKTGIQRLTDLQGAPLPRRLADPLFFLYPFVLATTQLYFILSVSDSLKSYFMLINSRENYFLFSLGYNGALFSFLLLILNLTQPKLQTNALYLRSFRKDSESEYVREHIEIAIGPDYRLSGIRDPKKRIHPTLRPLLNVVMSLRYAGARFLNLEAGDDWIARLWRSIGDSRILFLDLRDLTEHVEKEIRLGVSSISLQQIMFIIDSSKTREQWRHQLSEIIDLKQSETTQIKMVYWQEGKERQFVQTINDFALESHQATEPNFSSFALVKNALKTKLELRKEKMATIYNSLAGFLLIAIIYLGLLFQFKVISNVIALIFIAITFYVLALIFVAIKGKLRLLAMTIKFNPHHSSIRLMELLQTILTIMLFAVSIWLVIWAN